MVSISKSLSTAYNVSMIFFENSPFPRLLENTSVTPILIPGLHYPEFEQAIVDYNEGKLGVGPFFQKFE